MFFKEPTEPVPSAKNPTELKQPYRGVAVDSRYHDFRNLLTHTSGYLWRIPEFYNQWLGQDDGVQGHDTETPGAFQQYRLIKDLEIRVTEPLSPNQDPTSREFEFTGSATLYHGFIPNVHDVFIADIGDGRSALLEVTEVEKSMITRDGLHTMSYGVIEFLTSAKHAELKSKVVLELNFVRDYVKFGNNPLLLDDQLLQYEKLVNSVNTLAYEYFNDFYCHDKATILAPDQDSTLYDPFLMAFTRAIIPESISDQFRAVKTLNTEGGTEFKILTLWDALLRQDERQLDFAKLYLRPKNIRWKRWLHYYGSIHYSGIDNIMYPKDDDSLGRDAWDDLLPSKEREFSRGVDLDVLISSDLKGLPFPTGVVPPIIHPVTVDDYYVFSEAFYKVQYEQMSVLEYLTTCMMDEDKAINIPLLLKAVDVSRYWGGLERYYYIPILILLCHCAMREVN